MATVQLKTIEPQDEQTLIAFWKQMAEETPEASRHLLSFLARAMAERGWLPDLAALVAQLVEKGEDRQETAQALGDLVSRRLVEIAPDGKRVAGLLGCVCTTRTEHRAHLANGVDLFTWGGMDLLTVNGLFARPVDAFTACGQCAAEIRFRMEEDNVVDVEPVGIAGYQASWDGRGPISEVARRSPLFCGDTCLDAWLQAHPDAQGLPFSGDLLLHVGAMMADESGGARFSLIATHA